MTELRYTLLCDGSSDRALLPLLTWLLREQGVTLPIQPEWADLGRLRKPPKGLKERIQSALALFPCDVLFIHRDAEGETYAKRAVEIEAALEEVELGEAKPVPVPVIPVRMQETWLLFDEQAIRYAAGNPRGRVSISLPPLSKLERLLDPKADLYEAIRQASELRGRRLKKLNTPQRAVLVAEYIEDFEPLRRLSAFRTLEKQVARLVKDQNWNQAR